MTRHIRFESWSGSRFAAGARAGTALRHDLLVLDAPRASRAYADPHRDTPRVTYEVGTWTSAEVRPGFDFTELVPSWNARTPPGTWIEVSLQVTTTTDRVSPWHVMGRWAETDLDIAPTSVPGQHSEVTSVDVDRLGVVEGAGSAYRVRVSLLRRAGAEATPSISFLGCVASDVRPGEHAASPERHGSGALALDVPTYSQRLHIGRYPQWCNGGEAWCSPTSTSMVLAYWGLTPPESDYDWVDAKAVDRFVPFAARHTFDHAYRAPGNWSFNAAYAARFGARAFVTRLRSLAEAEQFVRAGFPLVVGVAFTRDQLDGAGYDTAGHLTVIVGFDDNGDVVCNDPASHHLASNDEVRATFDREQFEQAWMRSAGGITYVIHPRDVAVPRPPVEANW